MFQTKSCNSGELATGGRLLTSPDGRELDALYIADIVPSCGGGGWPTERARFDASYLLVARRQGCSSETNETNEGAKERRPSRASANLSERQRHWGSLFSLLISGTTKKRQRRQHLINHVDEWASERKVFVAYLGADGAHICCRADTHTKHTKHGRQNDSARAEVPRGD